MRGRFKTCPYSKGARGSASGRDGALSKAFAAGRAPSGLRGTAEAPYRCAGVIFGAVKTMAYGMFDRRANISLDPNGVSAALQNQSVGLSIGRVLMLRFR